MRLSTWVLYYTCIAYHTYYYSIFEENYENENWSFINFVIYDTRAFVSLVFAINLYRTQEIHRRWRKKNGKIIWKPQISTHNKVNWIAKIFYMHYSSGSKNRKNKESRIILVLLIIVIYLSAGFKQEYIQHYEMRI